MPIIETNHNPSTTANSDNLRAPASMSSSMSSDADSVFDSDSSLSSPELTDSPLQLAASSTSTSSATSSGSSSSSSSAALSPTVDGFEQFKQRMQFTIYRVIVREMEHVRQQREKFPDMIFDEPIGLINALVISDQALQKAKAEQQDHIACSYMYQTYHYYFQAGIYETLNQILADHLTQPVAQQNIAVLNDAYKKGLEKAKTGCLLTILEILKERQGKFQYNEGSYTIPTADIERAIKTLNEAPSTFDLNEYSPSLQIYLTVIILPKLNGELARFDKTFTNVDDVQSTLAHYRLDQTLTADAQEKYVEILNTYAMSAADIISMISNNDRARERHISSLLAHPAFVPNELNYHPVLGYRLQEPERRALFTDCPLSVNYQDQYHNTLLHHAFANQNYAAAYQLIALGAQTGVKNHNGYCPSDYTSNPQRIEELNAIFQSDGQRAQSDVTKKLAEILAKQKKRNEKLAKWSALHSQKLLNERRKDTATLECLVKNAATLYHDDELIKQVKALHQSINTSWLGNSELKKRLGDFLHTAQRGRIKSVRVAEFGRPIALVVPPMAEPCTPIIDRTRERALERENGTLVQTLATREHELAARTVELTLANTTIARLEEEKSEVEKNYHQAMQDATTHAQAASQARQELADLVTQSAALAAESKQLLVRAETAERIAMAAQKSADDANSKLIDLSSTVAYLTQRFNEMDAPNRGSTPVPDACDTQTAESPRNSPRFFGAQ